MHEYKDVGNRLCVPSCPRAFVCLNLFANRRLKIGTPEGCTSFYFNDSINSAGVNTSNPDFEKSGLFLVIIVPISLRAAADT